MLLIDSLVKGFAIFLEDTTSFFEEIFLLPTFFFGAKEFTIFLIVLEFLFDVVLSFFAIFFVVCVCVFFMFCFFSLYCSSFCVYT